MAESNSDRLFRTKVLPIMDKVRRELNDRCTDEIESKQNTMAYLFSGAMGPDGGASAMTAQVDSLRYTGKWNSKHIEDYIAMVKEELSKQKIAVTPEIEKKMIDKMINLHYSYLGGLKAQWCLQPNGNALGFRCVCN